MKALLVHRSHHIVYELVRKWLASIDSRVASFATSAVTLVSLIVRVQLHGAVVGR